MELIIFEGTLRIEHLTALMDMLLWGGTEEEELIVPTHTTEESLEIEKLLIPIQELEEELLIRITQDLEHFSTFLLMDVITDDGQLGTLTLGMKDSTRDCT